MIDNRGSIVKLMAFQVDTIKLKYDIGKVWIIPVKQPKYWEVKSVMGQPFSLREESSMADHGKRVQVTISGRLPKAAITDEQVDILNNGAFIVITVDAKGHANVCGTELVPLRCNVNKDTGELPQDFNGYSFVFEGVESELSKKCSLDVLYCI